MNSKRKSMGNFNYLRMNGTKEGTQDLLRIKQVPHFNVTASLRAFGFVDKDTQQFVFYIPSLELTSYGETKSKANIMLKEALNSTMDFWSTLSVRDLHKELGSLGWKQNTFKHKEYSNSYVDKDGKLKGHESINAVDDKIEISVLTV